jgi:hypothetical protein
VVQQLCLCERSGGLETPKGANIGVRQRSPKIGTVAQLRKLSVEKVLRGARTALTSAPNVGIFLTTTLETAPGEPQIPSHARRNAIYYNFPDRRPYDIS